MEAEEVRKLQKELGKKFQGRKAGVRYSITWSDREGGIEIFGWGANKIKEAKEIEKEIMEVTEGKGHVETNDVITGEWIE